MRWLRYVCLETEQILCALVRRSRGRRLIDGPYSSSTPQKIIERDFGRSCREFVSSIIWWSTFKAGVITSAHEGVASFRRRLQRCTESSRIRRTLNRCVSNNNFRHKRWWSFALLVTASPHELTVIVAIIIAIVVVFESVKHVAHSARSRRSVRLRCSCCCCCRRYLRCRTYAIVSTFQSSITICIRVLHRVIPIKIPRLQIRVAHPLIFPSVHPRLLSHFFHPFLIF